MLSVTVGKFSDEMQDPNHFQVIYVAPSSSIWHSKSMSRLLSARSSTQA